MYRFGLGLILQAKVQLSAPAPDKEPVESPLRRRTSRLVRLSSLLFRRHSSRSRSTAHGRDKPSGVVENSEEPSQEQSLSPTMCPLSPSIVKSYHQIVSQSDDLPKPEIKPRYNTAPFHQFMSDTFPGAVKLEEHQVDKKIGNLEAIANMTPPPTNI